MVLSKAMKAYQEDHPHDKIQISTDYCYSPTKDIFCNEAYNFRYRDYMYLAEHGRKDIIEEITSKYILEEYEDVIICLVAIRVNESKILEILNSKEFNFNQNLSFIYIDKPSILSFAMETSFDMLQTLIEFGAEVNYNNGEVLRVACAKNKVDEIKFLLTLEISEENLVHAFFASCDEEYRVNSKNFYFVSNRTQPKSGDLSYIAEMFLSRGIDINNYKCTLYDILAKHNISATKKLLSYGMIIDSSLPLFFACYYNNIELIEFYLQQGLQVDKNILQLVMHNVRMVDIPCIELFIKYDVDFSLLSPHTIKSKHHHIITELESRGLDKNIFFDMVLKTNSSRAEDDDGLDLKKLGDTISEYNAHKN